MKAKYRQGVGQRSIKMTAGGKSISKDRNVPSKTGGHIKTQGRGTTGTRRQPESMIGGNSMIGSGSRRQLDHPEDISPYEKEYNTDISQFLNSKQTFNNSITTSTERDLDSVGQGFGSRSRG